MTAARAKQKKSTSIPVKVSVDSRPAPTHLPPVTPEIIAPATPTRPTPKIPAALQTPAQALRQPVHEWPEARRRQLMWWLVAGAATIIVVAWIGVLQFETTGPKGKNLFSEAWSLLKTVHWPGSASKTATPAEQEIRNLDSQVFPQFQQ